MQFALPTNETAPTNETSSKKRKTSSGNSSSSVEEEQEEEEDLSLFVGGLPSRVDVNDIKQFFPGATYVKMIKKGGRFQCAAFVQFARVEDIEASLRLNGSKMMNRTLRVNRGKADKPKRHDVKHKDRLSVHVGNLSFSTGDQKVKSIFGNCGLIRDVKLPLWRDTGRLRGFAIVDFVKEVSVERALKLDGMTIDGRVITVERVRPKEKRPVQRRKKRDKKE